MRFRRQDLRMGQLFERLWVSAFVRVVLECTLPVGLLDVVVACRGVDTEDIAI